MLSAGDPFGRFTIERELGRGPTSAVYLAIERDSRWKAAVKLFLLEPGAPPADREPWGQRVLRELRAAASLQHEAIVRVHEIGQYAGAPYLIRDFIEGRPLAEYVGDRSPASFPSKVAWLRALACALADIHRAGLVHRDVKPTNALVRRDGALRLLDFGVARRSLDRAAGVVVPRSVGSAGLTHDGAPASAAYVAPERLANQPSSAPADQFGWGVVAYELLAGRLPWARSDGQPPSAVKMIESILTATPPSVRFASPEVPAGMDAVLTRAMAKRPGGRYPTMDDLVRDFDAAVR